MVLYVVPPGSIASRNLSLALTIASVYGDEHPPTTNLPYDETVEFPLLDGRASLASIN
jgi:hypothetical protein